MAELNSSSEVRSRRTTKPKREIYTQVVFSVLEVENLRIVLRDENDEMKS
jgi:hypothetical protein